MRPKIVKTCPLCGGQAKPIVTEGISYPLEYKCVSCGAAGPRQGGGFARRMRGRRLTSGHRQYRRYRDVRSFSWGDTGHRVIVHRQVLGQAGADDKHQDRANRDRTCSGRTCSDRTISTT